MREGKRGGKGKIRGFKGPPRDFGGGGGVGVFGGCKKWSRTNPTKKLGEGILGWKWVSLEALERVDFGIPRKTSYEKAYPQRKVDRL